MAKVYEEPVNSGGLHNVLATGTLLTGKVVAESDFRIDGRVEGEIHCKGKIVIGPKGSIKGNIESVNAEVFGNIEGTMAIRERLILKSSAEITGDVVIQTLEIEPGAKFNGTCKMSGANMQPVTAPVPENAQKGK